MIRVLYFAWVREGVGADEEQVEVPPGLTVASLLDRLETRSPGHAEALKVRARLRYAVNQAIVEPDHAVNDGDEVAVFPPVTGG